jgi:hypothetical protein
MAQFHRQATRLLLATAVACLARAEVRAAQDADPDALKGHGLKIVGSLALADTEAPIKSKLTEARRLSQQIRSLRLKESSALGPEERQKAITSINDQMGQLRNEMTAVNQQLNQIPRMRGRLVNNYAQAQYNQLQAYRSSLQFELSQESALLNQLKSQPVDPKAKEKIESEIRDKTEQYHQSLLDLRKLVDETTQKYSELKDNKEVQKVLDRLNKSRTDKYKLGPSHDFSTNVKLLEKLEKAATDGDTETAPAKSTRRSRKTAKARRPVASDE